MKAVEEQEVSMHSSESDAWVIFEGKVLDITNFMPSHPGGKQYFSPFLGKDITDAFAEADHSQRARTMIDDLVVGYLSSAEVVGKAAKKRLIDHTQGTLYQVWSKLSLAEYIEFINTPHHVDSSVRIFGSDLLEPFTKTAWYVIPIFWLPVAFYYLVLSQLGFVEMLLWWAVGVFYWTFFEYMLHRFGFHAEIYLPESRFLICFHYLIHGIHHAYPMDGLRLVFPPAAGVILGCVFKPLYNLFLPLPISHAIWAGKITGYIIYDVFHYFEHHAAVPLTYFRYMKTYHMYHHYKIPDLGYGVSNKLWDIVFDTEIPMKGFS